ncbi:MAG: hypothetical protein WB919_05290, partial [Candidatus Sulfotelmatobacter sp.]
LRILSALEASLLDGDISKQTHDSITAQIAGAATNSASGKNNKAGASKRAEVPHTDASTIAGLLLGSPEFQRR